MSSIRENWRIVLLVVLVLASTVALFVNLGGASGGGGQAVEDTGPTNLQYGLELSGGTRIRAPLVGMTAEGVEFSGNDPSQVQRTVARELNVSITDVQTRPGLGAVELYTDNRSQAEFRSAVETAGLEPNNVRGGVTEPTRQTTIRVLNDKINKGGLTGGGASIARSPTGEVFVLVEVPNANRSEVLDLIGDRGQVSIVAGYPQNGTSNYTRTPVLQQDDLASVGRATEGRGTNPPFVPVTLTDESARRFSNDMQQYGFTSQQGVENCRWTQNEENYGYCLFTVVDGRVVFASSMGSGLAEIIRNGGFVQDPSFRMIASNMSEAQDLQLNLRAGALPTNLAIQDGTTFFLEP